jgi:hypothetical protein
MLTVIQWIVTILGFTWLWIGMQEIIDRQERRDALRRAFITPEAREADLFENGTAGSTEAAYSPRATAFDQRCGGVSIHLRVAMDTTKVTPIDPTMKTINETKGSSNRWATARAATKIGSCVR